MNMQFKPGELALQRRLSDIVAEYDAKSAAIDQAAKDFAAAGQRVGMDGDRGNLALVALGIASKLRPRWLVFENVPGLLSSYSGSAEAERSLRDRAERGGGQIGETADAFEDSDFAAFLSLVQQCGYFGCYRIIDAQYAGVPQRRRRVFFVGHLGDWRPAAAVLLEPESLRGDRPPSREARQRVAGTISAGLERCSADEAERNTLIAAETSPTLRAGGNRTGGDRPPGTDADTADSLIVGAVSAKWAKGTGGPAGDECYNLVAPPLNAGMGKRRGSGAHADPIIAADLRNGSVDDVAMALQGGGQGDERGRCINAIPHIVGTLGKRSADHVSGLNSEADFLIPEVADPISANEQKTTTHEGYAGVRPHNLIVTPILEAGARTGRAGHEGVDGLGIGEPGDPMFTLQATKQHAVAFQPRHYSDRKAMGGAPSEVAHPLTSEDHKGDSQQVVAFDTTQITNKDNRSNPQPGDPSHPLTAGGDPPAIAFSCKDSGADASIDQSPTLRAMNETDGNANANAGGQIAIAYGIGSHAGTAEGEQTNRSHAKGGPVGSGISEEMAHGVRAGRPPAVAISQPSKGVMSFQPRVGRNGRGVETDIVAALGGADAGATSDMRPCVVVPADAEIFKPSHFTRDKDGAPSDLSPPLSREADKGDQEAVLFQGAAVRRLTPRECERLQAFEDDYTLVTYRGKPAADGPRYKALGNSMCVNELRWILSRIETYEKVIAK